MLRPVPGKHIIINDVTVESNGPTQFDQKAGGVNQHNDFAHRDGRFWVTWSDGLGAAKQ